MLQGIFCLLVAAKLVWGDTTEYDSHRLLIIIFIISGVGGGFVGSAFATWMRKD